MSIGELDLPVFTFTEATTNAHADGVDSNSGSNSSSVATTPLSTTVHVPDTAAVHEFEGIQMVDERWKIFNEKDTY